MGDRRLDSTLALAGIGDVRRDGQGACSELVEILGSAFERGDSAGEQRDVGAESRRTDGSRMTDARRAARDENDLPL
jgi:hypothetical protein